MRSLIVAVLALVLFQGPGPADGQEARMVWDVTWAQAVRVNRDETIEIQRWGDAELELVQRGDSVAGTWFVDVIEPVRWNVVGTLVEGRLELVAREHDSTNPDLAQVQEMRWRGTVEGDSVEGEMTMVFRGARRDMPWRPWLGKRKDPEGSPAGPFASILCPQTWPVSRPGPGPCRTADHS